MFIPKDWIDNNKVILMGAIFVEQVNILSYRGLKIILLQLLSHFPGANEKIQFAVSNPLMCEQTYTSYVSPALPQENKKINWISDFYVR